MPGPIFANVILADEINRTPPKTQAALLEAMQEHQITVGGKRHRLAEPFFVLATQNPIEQEGTYPLPEAQLDRFMFNIFVDYPGRGRGIRDRQADHGRRATSQITPTLAAEEIVALQQIVRRVPVADHVTRYALQFTRLTRPRERRRARLHPAITSVGAPARGPASTWCWAPRPGPCCTAAIYVDSEDIRAVAFPVLRHRIMTNFNAEAEGVKPDDIIRRLIETIPVDDSETASAWKAASKYLDPQTLAKLQGLELRARLIVEGYVSGVHRSPYHGFSIEFAEHREYAQGDDLRYVDWKVFGKTDKFYLKQYEEETNLVSYMLLDTSESMRYRSADAPMSKLEYAQCVAASLAYLILQQQDSVGLVTFDNEIRGAGPAPAAILRT